MQASAISPKKMLSRLSFHKHLIQAKKPSKHEDTATAPEDEDSEEYDEEKDTGWCAGTMRCKM